MAVLFALLAVPPICHLQGLLSLLFVSPFAYLKMEESVVYVGCGDGWVYVHGKCVLETIFLLSYFHIYTRPYPYRDSMILIHAFLLTPLPS